MAPRPESLKKVIDVLGDFNPSEDKIKKTLGIGEDELKMVKEESVNNQVIKERHPINKRDTKKAQSTLGLNLSKEKLMDVFGVDEDTITEASAEENEIQEIKIKRLRENITLSNKRALKKALMIMGCDPSSSKIMRTLGVSEMELSKDIVQSSQQKNLTSLLVSVEITVFFLLFYFILYFLNLV